MGNIKQLRHGTLTFLKIDMRHQDPPVKGPDSGRNLGTEEAFFLIEWWNKGLPLKFDGWISQLFPRFLIDTFYDSVDNELHMLSATSLGNSFTPRIVKTYVMFSTQNDLWIMWSGKILELSYLYKIKVS